jgi:hypothetical protein
MEVKFKVAMDNEQAKLKNHKTVTLEVQKCNDTVMMEYALKAYVVELQSNIRANWTAFLKGDYAKNVTIGTKLFASNKGVVTKEKAKAAYKDSMAEMTMMEKLKTLHDDGMISDEMFEASVISLFEKGEIDEDEMNAAIDGDVENEEDIEEEIEDEDI